MRYLAAGDLRNGLPSASPITQTHYLYACVPFRYEVQDLRVTDILPQMVALSESFFQVYELKGAK